MQKKLRVCVTAVGGGGFGEQILKALRMAQTPYYIVGTDIVHESTGFSRVDKPCLVPAARKEGYVETMLTLCKEHDVQALLAGSEAELLVLSQHRHLFASQGVFFPGAPHEVLELCLDKCALFEKLDALGIATPRFKRVKDVKELGELTYPLVLKPSQDTGGSNNVFIVQDATEARVFGSYLLRFADEFIAQEYMGTAEEEYTVGVLTDMHGALIQSMALHRSLRLTLSRRLSVPNRTGRAELGKTLVISSGISQGRTGAYPHITAQCERMAEALGARGPFNIQCRVVNGNVYPFEINPRFSGTTCMRAMAGMNEPDLLLRMHVLGEEVSRQAAIAEKTILRCLHEIEV